MSVSSSSLSSQVSMDAAPSPPSRSVVAADYPRNSEGMFEQSHLSVDAMVGPEESGSRFQSSVTVSRECRQPINQPYETRNPSLPRPEVRTYNQDPLKGSEGGYNSFEASDSSYGSMSSIEASSLTTSDNWKNELKQYEDKMPPNLRMGFLDVLILYHEDDRAAAEEFRQHLMTDIKVDKGPIKTLLYDDETMVSICGSLIGYLDLTVQRSTYVFIYLTKTFVSDKWCEFQSESCLMEAITNPNKMWCVVPVYTEKRNKSFRVPMGLNTLKGINYYNNDQFYRKGVARLIGDKINVRIQADKEHAIKQKQWIEDYKRKQIKQEEEMKRVFMYEEEKTRKAEEWVQQETERLIKMGVLPSSITHSSSDSDMKKHPPVLQHSQSVNSLKPVQPQNPVVREYFHDLLQQQKSEDYNHRGYSREELEIIERFFSRQQPAKTAPTREHLTAKFSQGQAMIPPVERATNYSQNQQFGNRYVPETNNPVNPPVGNFVPPSEPSDLPIEILKQIQHLSISEQEKWKQEYYQQVREHQSQHQQLNQPQQQIQNQQQHQMQQQQQQFHLLHQQHLQQQRLQQQHHHQQQQHGIQSPQNYSGQDSLSKDMPESWSSYGANSQPNRSSLGPTMPAFDQLNSIRSSGSASSVGYENWKRSSSMSTSQSSSSYGNDRNTSSVSNTHSYQQASVDGSQSLSPGNLPNDSLIDWRNETDGPSPPSHKYNSAPLSQKPAQSESTKVTQTVKEDDDSYVSKTGTRKKEKVIKKRVIHQVINVYHPSNVQIGSHNLINENTINQVSDDSDDDDDGGSSPGVNKNDDKNSTENPITDNPMMKKVEVPSGTRSHAELGTQGGTAPFSADGAPSTVAGVRHTSASPLIQANDKTDDIEGAHLTHAKEVPLTHEPKKETDPKATGQKGNTPLPKINESQPSIKSNKSFEDSVNKYSSESEKPSVKSVDKDIQLLSSPEKSTNKCKPRIAIVQPVAKITPMVPDTSNENEDVTCEKTVVDTEYTARKDPVGYNEHLDKNDEDQTCVKEVVNVSRTATRCEPRHFDNEDNIKNENIGQSIENSKLDSTNSIDQRSAIFSTGRQSNVKELFYNRPNLSGLLPSVQSYEDGENIEGCENLETSESLGARGCRGGNSVCDTDIDLCHEVTEDPTEGAAEDFEVVDNFYQEPLTQNETSSSFEESGRMRGNKWSKKGSSKNDKDCSVS